MERIKTAIAAIGLLSLFTTLFSGSMTVLLAIWVGVKLPETVLSAKIFATSGIILLVAVILTSLLNAMEDF